MSDLISRHSALCAIAEIAGFGSDIDLERYVVKACDTWEHGYGLLDAVNAIKGLPPVQPDTTTHDSIPAKTGKNDGDGTSGDCISRQAAIDGGSGT